MTAVATPLFMMKKETEPPSVQYLLTMKGIEVEHGLMEKGKDAVTCRETNGVSN